MNKEQYEFCSKYITPSLMHSSDYMAKCKLDPNYLFPKYLKNNNDSKTSRTINVEYFRQICKNNNIVKGDTCYFRNYLSDLETINYEGNQIREYVIPVDIKEWRAYLGLVAGITENKITLDKRYESEWNRSYFLLDSYFPKYATDIEIDGTAYHKYPNLDKTRDRYLEVVYGIKTFRFPDYGMKKSDPKNLSRIFKTENLRPKPYHPDISKFVLKYFMFENGREYTSFKILWRLVGDLKKKFGENIISNLKDIGKFGQRRSFLKKITGALGLYYTDSIQADLIYMFDLIGIKLEIKRA